MVQRIAVVVLSGLIIVLLGVIGFRLRNQGISPAQTAPSPVVSVVVSTQSAVVDQVPNIAPTSPQVFTVITSPAIATANPTEATYVANLNATMSAYLVASPTPLPECQSQIVNLSSQRNAEIILEQPSTIWYVGQDLPPKFNNPVKYHKVEGTFNDVHIYNYSTYNVMKDVVKNSGQIYAFEAGSYIISSSSASSTATTILICPPLQ